MQKWMNFVAQTKGPRSIQVFWDFWKCLTLQSPFAKKVAGHQGLQLHKVVGPDEKL